MKFATILAATAAVAIGGPAFATNLLINPGFENQTFPGTTGYYNIGSPGDHPVPSDFGWTVSNGNVDIISYVTYGPAPTNGGNYGLDLVGYGSTGEISQSIDTEAGVTYKVTFDYESNPGFPNAKADVGFNGNGSIGSVAGGKSWQTFTGTFVGTGSPLDFSVNETVGGNNGGVFLDNFSISPIPEPAAWALMLVGFGGLGATLRRRRTLVAA